MMIRTNIHLPAKLIEAYDALALELGVPRAEVIRRVLQDHLDKKRAEEQQSKS